jgi:hypothetical protein
MDTSPNDQAALKLLRPAICNIEDKRDRERLDEQRKGGKQQQQRKAQGRLIEGAKTTNWNKVLEQLALVYPDRIHPTSKKNKTTHLHRKLGKLLFYAKSCIDRTAQH